MDDRTVIRETPMEFKERKMRHLGPGSLRRLLTLLGVALMPLLAAGCGPSGVTLYPVTGKITFDDEPFVRQTTTVVLKSVAAKPDEAEAELEPVGKIDFSGNYEVFTGARKGAPPGRYKVVVTAHDEAVDLKKARSKRPVPNSLLPFKYASAETTDLEIEVVPRPAAGAYDLKLKR
jgi:hypothetical protein